MGEGGGGGGKTCSGTLSVTVFLSFALNCLHNYD